MNLGLMSACPTNMADEVSRNDVSTYLYGRRLLLDPKLATILINDFCSDD